MKSFNILLSSESLGIFKFAASINVGKIEQQTEFLKAYLAETFKERRHSIDEMFERLDKGIEAGNMDLVNVAMESITTIVKSSPLKEAEKIIQALNDPNIEKIEF